MWHWLGYNTYLAQKATHEHSMKEKGNKNIERL